MAAVATSAAHGRASRATAAHRAPNERRARAEAPTPVRPPLRIVAAAPRRRLGWVLLGACGLVFVSMLALTAFQARIAQNQIRIDRLDQELRDARAYYDRLRLAVAQLESPEYVVPRATNDLAMVSAETPQYLSPTAAAVREVLIAAGPEDAPLGGPGATDRAGWGEIKRLADAQP